MKILKRTKGIDLKAKNPGLHGSVCIQFRDPITGKVTDEEKHDNFFTDALNSIFNECPWAMDRMVASSGVFAGDTEYKSIYERFLGGILLFPQSLGDSVSDLYAPFTNSPTGIGSMQPRTITDLRQGNFNTAESDKLSNGYRYVYDWATSYGNGNIAAVALSHEYCYDYFTNGETMFFPYSTNVYQSRGFNRVCPSSCAPLAASDNGILWYNGDSLYTYKPVFWIPWKAKNFSVLQQFTDSFDVANDAAWSYSYEGNIKPTFQCYDGKIAVIQRNAGVNQPCTITFLSETDGSVISTITRTWNADLTYSQNGYAIKDGYLYATAQFTNGKIFKCSLSADADFDEIPIANVVANTPCITTEGSDNIYGSNWILNNGVVTQMTVQNHNIEYYDSYQGANIIYENGVWAIGRLTTLRNQRAWNAMMKTPYLATKNNLDSVKTKTGDKTMKVIYTVTQV